MIRASDQMVRSVLLVLGGAIVVYLVAWELPQQRAVSPIAPTIQGTQSAIFQLEGELAQHYVVLTQLYRDQGNLVQAAETVRTGLEHFPNNLDLVRLQADLQTNY